MGSKGQGEEMSESASKTAARTIGTKSLDVGYADPGGLFRPQHRKTWRVLDSRELLRSLHNIKDMAKEEHTKNNLQTLIDQIDNQGLTL